MQKFNTVLVFISIITISGCSASKELSCSVSEYAVYHYNNSQNSQCKEQYNEEEMIFGFGDAEGQSAAKEMLKSMAQMKARSAVAQKMAQLQGKIKVYFGRK